MRKIPKINASISRWIISIIFSYGLLILMDSEKILEKISIDSRVLIVLLPVVSLIGLLVLDRGILKKLFHIPKIKEVLLAFGVAILAIVVGAILASLNFETVENPIVGVIDEIDPKFLVFMLAFQLFWEEIIRIIPFLAVYNYFSKRIGERWGVILAWILSSIIFGALHLPTYNYNIVQSIFLIGGVTFVLNFAYIRTKNLWTVYFAHLFYDMLLLSMVMLIG